MGKEYGPYQIILADPPWRWKNWTSSARAVKGERWGRAMGRPAFDCMDMEEIASLLVKDLAQRDCILFLWVPYPKLAEGIDVIRRWEFTFKTVAWTWVKLNPTGEMYETRNASGKKIIHVVGGFHYGLGYYSRSNPEICLLATRGSPKRVSNRVENLVFAPRGRHSEKPGEVHERITTLMGDLPRVELFARQEVPGWTCIGNEITGEDIRTDIERLVMRSGGHEGAEIKGARAGAGDQLLLDIEGTGDASDWDHQARV